MRRRLVLDTNIAECRRIARPLQIAKPAGCSGLPRCDALLELARSSRSIPFRIVTLDAAD